MQITEQIIQRIARQVFNQMFPSSLRQSGAIISGSGGSVQYAAEAGHAASADSATNATKDGDGNTISSTYLKLAGGTLTGALTINPSNTSSFQDGIILNDRGTGASEALTIKWTSASYTTGVKLSADLANKYLVFHNGTAWQTIYHSGNNPFIIRGELADAYINGTTYSTLDNGTYLHTYIGASETIIHFQRSNCSASGLDIRFKYPQDSSNPLQYRKCIDSNRFASTDWVTLIDSLNIGSQSVSYATSAGSATKATQDGDGNTISSTYIKQSGSSVITGSLVPNADNAIDLGSSSKRWRYIFSYGMWGTSGNPLRLGGNDATLMYLTSDAKCGIGTDSPSQKLHVSGGLLAVTNNSRTVTIGAQNSSGIHIYNDNSSPFFFNGDVCSNASKTYDLGSSTYPWGTLYAAGCNIYDTSPSVHVGTSSSARISLHWSSNSNRGLYDYTGYWVVATNGTNTFMMKGNVGIGTTSPSYKLHVSGQIYCTGGFTFLSDIRKKDVITYQWAPCLSAIAEAPIIRYTLKGDKEKRERIGSVAQYWQKITPEAVTEAHDGTLSMDYGSIALTAVIALAREVKQLKAQVARLTQQRNG